MVGAIVDGYVICMANQTTITKDWLAICIYIFMKIIIKKQENVQNW